jgi:hypothetical protein
MFDWAWYAYTMRRAYGNRLPEAEESRIRRACVKEKRSHRLLVRVRAWLEGRVLAWQTERSTDPQSRVKEAAVDSKAGGSLIL